MMRHLPPMLVRLAILALLPQNLFAQEPDFLAKLRPYRPEHAVTGTIRSWGNNYMIPLMAIWEEGFRKYHPGVHFETTLNGTETAIAGLYSGVADLGIMGREIYNPEVEGFERWFGYKPMGIQLTSGSHNNAHKNFALMIFVHTDNPLSQLTLPQVAAIFGCDCRECEDQPIRTWGQLGLEAGANRPIDVYGYGIDSGFSGFFRSAVFKDGRKWNSEMKEFYSAKSADGSVIDGGKLMLDALAHDPYGIAFANVRYGNPRRERLRKKNANAATRSIRSRGFTASPPMISY
jgi:phosphate transport system substrate-binding protein